MRTTQKRQAETQTGRMQTFAVPSQNAQHATRVTDPESRARFTLSASRRAFTMIEIAISLAVIGFALVAIIGILPTAMNVQKDNRQETIINQDNSVLMNAVRNGERGLDDLTNYVIAITNYWSAFGPRGNRVGPPHTSGFTYTSSSTDGALSNPQYPITNGLRIIGLLSRPKIIPQPGGAYISNHVIAFMRSISGSASEKVPQTNSTLQEFALSYKLISEVIPYGTNFFNPDWTNYRAFPVNSQGWLVRSNYSILVSNLQANLHELRLTYRWPILPNGNSGPGRQVFRTAVSGFLQPSPEPGFNNLEDTLFFFQPGSYVQAP